MTTGDFNQEEEGGLAVERQIVVEGQEGEDALEFLPQGRLLERPEVGGLNRGGVEEVGIRSWQGMRECLDGM